MWRLSIMTTPLATIVVPAYNEGERLRAGFERLLTAGREGRVDLERTALLYVDDGSSDSTPQVAAELARQIPHAQVLELTHNQGKGAAVRAGIFATQSPLVVFTDADFAIDPRQMPDMLAALASHRLAVGSRVVKGHINYGTGLRTRAGRGFNALVRGVSSVELRDTQCGWKGMQTAWAKVLFHLVSTKRFAFDVELLVRASYLGITPEEVAVSWRDVAGSHVRVARDSLQMLGDLAKVRVATHVPRFLGIQAPDNLTMDEISQICVSAGLSGTPVLTGRSGERSVLAVGINESQATKALAAVRREFHSGTVRVVSIPEIRFARHLELALDQC